MSVTPSSEGFGWSPAWCECRVLTLQRHVILQGPCRDHHCPGVKWQLRLLPGDKLACRGAWAQGEEVPGRGVTLLRTLCSQPLGASCCHSPAQARPLQWESHRLGVGVLSFTSNSLFFFSSVFKKIFCQGESLDHRSLAVGLPARCPTRLAGGGGGLGTGGVERRFSRFFSASVPSKLVPGSLGDQGLPARAQAWDHLS